MGIPKYELNRQPLNVAADQEFDPNSTNAVSGVALAAVLAGQMLTMRMPAPGTYGEASFMSRSGISSENLAKLFDGTFKWICQTQAIQTGGDYPVEPPVMGAAADICPVVFYNVSSSQYFSITIRARYDTWTISRSPEAGVIKYTVSRKPSLDALSTEVSYATLVGLRNNGELVPGLWYRITDYRCSTLQANTMAATNAFDILVRADDASHLNENAFAMHHTGDTYFQNCNLEAWQLKYCLDNDADRFAWADDVDGRGVIFYMKDEWGNECPYDFKNIMFQRWAVTEDQDHPSLVVDNADNNYGYYYGAKNLQGNNVLSKATYGEDTGYFYTFALKDLESGDWFDYTVAAHLGLKNDEGNEVACYDNHLIEATDEYGSGKGEMAKMLNNIVFFNCYGDLSDTSYSDDYSYCNNNRFLGNCQSNTFGNSCQNNSFGNYFQNNTFGNDCGSNTFGNNCGSNTFGNSCGSNSFGNNFNQNSFGNECSYNSFGNDCRQNSFGNYCNNNSFGNNCGGNTFGNDFQNNSFGNYCSWNSFGNNCARNTFGNGCTYNTFGNGFYSNIFGNNCVSNSFGNYCKYITVFDGVQYCSVSGGSADNAPVKNAQILNGTAGASAANKLTIAFTANASYTQVAAKDSSGNLQIWNPADLVE